MKYIATYYSNYKHVDGFSSFEEFTNLKDAKAYLRRECKIYPDKFRGNITRVIKERDKKIVFSLCQENAKLKRTETTIFYSQRKLK